MHFSTIPLFATLASFASAAAVAKPPAFFLAGDSTTAVQSAGGGGWGAGFLNTTLKNGATGKNFGHNGATTVSFRAGGDWAKVIAAAKASAAKSSPYITIQFGHNDQKPLNNITIPEFTANLIAFVDEARAAGATPIVVTSLSRRNFSNGKIVENLADVVAAAKAAAAQSKADIIDLNGASTKYLNAIGATNAATYNLNPTDFTHLNAQGSVVFGNMVAQLIDAEVPAVKSYVVPVPAVAKAINAGTYIFPSV